MFLEPSCAGLIQGWEENEIRYVPESVVDVQSFGAHCMTLYAHGLLHSQKITVKTEPTADWISPEHNQK